MFYKQVEGLATEPFKRLTGVKPGTFAVMVGAVRKMGTRKRKAGRPSKLSIEDQVLMMLMYLRENRTYFHIGHTYGINASTAYRIIRRVVLDWQTKRVLCTYYGKGKTHDLKLFRASKVRLQPDSFLLADSGYQGLQRLHPNTELPYKRRRGCELEPCERQHNKALARLRLNIEHVNARLKVFRILGDRYRCRRRRFGLRFNLIAGFYNFELVLNSSFQ